MNIKLSAALAAALALSACGGGGDAEIIVNRHPHCHATVTVQLFGDSTQVAAYRYGYLQEVLDARFGAGRVVLLNQAASGTNSTQLVAGTDGVNTPWPKDLDADIAVVNHGINDEAYKVPMATYEANMRLFAAGNGRTRMVIETPNPIAPTMNLPDAPWAEVGRSVAAESHLPVADMQAYVLSLPGWESMLSDGLHPTPELQQQIARRVTGPTLIPIVASILCPRH